MLLRSASTPILNSWKPQLKETSPEAEIVLQFPKSRPVSLCASSKSSPPHPMIGGSGNHKMMRIRSESDLSNLPVEKNTPSMELLRRFHEIEEREEAVESTRMAFLDGGLCCSVDEGGVGGVGCGGGGSDGGGDGCSGSWDSNHENDRTDLYYQKMIEANPENSLLLSNYALFLKEVCGDLIKAEEYCGKAILANPNDGDVLSMYADLIWENHKDASRAESYYDQATKASPDNCYVLASYARFLWDAEEEEDEDNEEVEDRVDSFGKPSSPPFVFGVQPQLLPLAAAS
ncbi:uncharacterized protein LOC111013150 [Momordica charantia]|uniref:Uncharacterized protein LOC111013150 n=1 Tax=Momordica charantia TaxID=3673 RepID=A0A6J1CN93_MOMCH|nr:uncharacterized protein LOC111013150 [Momordica charantia]